MDHKDIKPTPLVEEIVEVDVNPDEGKHDHPDSKNDFRLEPTDEHYVPLPELIDRLNSKLDYGLTHSRAEELNAKLGDNMLSERKKTPWYIEIIKEMFTPFSNLLWAAALLSLAGHFFDEETKSHLYLSITLVVVIILFGLVSYYQKAKSESIMESFKNFLPQMCQVQRDGSWASVDSKKVVPGDMIKISMGNKLPADIRLIRVAEMKVDNSSLTGESEPQLRGDENINKDNILESSNMAFFGTICSEGEGIGIVTRIGDKTVLGQIARHVDQEASPDTPLRIEMNRFIKFITSISIGLGAVFFGLGFLGGGDILSNFIFALGIIVANVPEGLIATVAVALSLTAKKLAKQKMLVKNIEAVETLGSISCILSDKTGTLTQNKMTAQHIWYDGAIHRLDNKEKCAPNHKFDYDENNQTFKEIHHCSVVNSEAYFNNSIPTGYQPQKESPTLTKEELYLKEISTLPWAERPVLGDATETAIIRFFQPLQDIQQTRKQFPVVVNSETKMEAKLPFNSTNKFSLRVVANEQPDSHYCVYLKGAPEIVMKFCTRIMCQGRLENVDRNWEDKFTQSIKQFSRNGERVLAFAKLHLPKQQYPFNFNFVCSHVSKLSFPLTNFTLLGLIAIRDPPRDAVPYSVRKCQSAGIKVIMITGDHPETAEAIARECHIIRSKTNRELQEESPHLSIQECINTAPALVIQGSYLSETMAQPDGRYSLMEWLKKPEVVFARTTPAQKMQIVEAAQELGHIVAVTGDGVNDSPAIKCADIGVAMGVMGSDAAKDAADMVLLTDDFSAIVIGVEEGRKIFDNIKKTIAYIVASNIPELTPFLLLVILQVPLPLSAVLVLAIDMGTDMIPAVAFSFEEAEMDIMTRSPRMKWEHLVTNRLLVYSYFQQGMIQAFGSMFVYFIVMNDFGFQIVELIGMAHQDGIRATKSDVFEETEANWGNNNAKCVHNADNVYEAVPKLGSLFSRPPDWNGIRDNKMDLRHFFLACDEDGNLIPRYEWSTCKVPQISPISLRPVCYTTEALRYAQSSYFYAVVIMQIVNSLCQKTRINSYFRQPYNFFMFFGFICEIALCLLLAFLSPLNIVFGTRDSIFIHFGVLAIPFAILQMVHDEIRKYLIRHFPKPDPVTPNWFERNSLW